MTDAQRDARQIYLAINKKDAELFAEIIATRPSRHLRHIQRDYMKIYGTNFLSQLDRLWEKPVQQIITGIMTTNRDVGIKLMTDQSAAEYDAKYLLARPPAQWTRNDSNFTHIIEIFSKRSFAQLYMMMNKVWDHLANEDFIDYLENGLPSGDFKDFIIEFSRFISYLPPKRYAEILKKSITTLPKDDDRIIHTLTSRAEIDLADIIVKYESFGDSLKEDISRLNRLPAYKQVLLSICGLEDAFY